MPPTTPTSQRPSKTAAVPKKSWLSRILLVIGIGLLSSTAGFAGTLLYHYYPPTWPWANKIVASEKSPNTPEVIYLNRGEDKSKTDIIDILKAHQSKTIVSIFPQDTDQFIPSEELGKGVIVSADGWIAVLSKVIDSQSQATPQATPQVSVVLANNDVVMTDQIIADPFSGVSYIHIDKTHLPVADFRTTPLHIGEEVILYTTSLLSGNRVSIGHLENINFNDSLELNTLHSNDKYLIDYTARSEYLGSPVFDNYGAMIGLNVLDNQVLPISTVASGLYDLFTNKEIIRPNIDITYQPLYRGVHTSDSSNVTKGVRIVSLGAVIPGLEIDDVILKVNDIDLDIEHDLATVISELKSDSTAKFTIRRSGVTKKVEVKIE